MNKWATILTPLLIIILSFILLSVDNKDPNEVINQANIKLNALQQYSLNSTMIISMNFFETPLISYFHKYHSPTNTSHTSNLSPKKAITPALIYTAHQSVTPGLN